MNREKGHYWVKTEDGDWIVGYYNEVWFLGGSWQYFRDSDLGEIVEKRIPTPDEGPIGLPFKVTAENGGKYLLNGEFTENIEVDNPDFCGCGDCDYCEMEPEQEESYIRKVTVSWPTIKDIYNKIVEYYSK